MTDDDHALVLRGEGVAGGQYRDSGGYMADRIDRSGRQQHRDPFRPLAEQMPDGVPGLVLVPFVGVHDAGEVPGGTGGAFEPVEEGGGPVVRGARGDDADPPGPAGDQGTCRLIRQKPGRAISRRTRSRISGLTCGSPLTTRETVFWETPALRATSVIETRPYSRPAPSPRPPG